MDGTSYSYHHCRDERFQRLALYLYNEWFEHTRNRLPAATNIITLTNDDFEKVGQIKRRSVHRQLARDRQQV